MTTAHHKEYDTLIQNLELSVRSWNCLRRANVSSVSEIIDLIRSGEIIKVRNLGRKSVEEIIEKVKKLTGMTAEELLMNVEKEN